MKVISHHAMSSLIAHDMNAVRYIWLREHWHSEMDGQSVPEWISRNLLRLGGLDKCLDVLMTASDGAEPTTHRFHDWILK